VKTHKKKIQLIHIENCTSTQDYLHGHVDEWLSRFPICVTAGSQSGGRGRHQRRWHSPPGLGLYFSWGFLLREKKSLPWVPLGAGVAVAETLKRFCSRRRIRLKWPNDVLLDGRKIAGILSESRITSEGVICICGIGINLNHLESDFPDDLRKRATSLRLSCGRSFEAAEILPVILSRLDLLHRNLEKRRIRGLRSRTRRLTRWMRCESLEFRGQSETRRGRFAGIARDGGLILLGANGNKEICYSGEVEWPDADNKTISRR